MKILTDERAQAFYYLSKMGRGIRVLDDSIRGERGGNGSDTGGARRAQPRCETTCWCDRKVVETTWDAIYNGEGVSCGRKNCHPPEQSC